MKLTIKVTANEKRIIQEAASDSVASVDSYVTDQVAGFIEYVQVGTISQAVILQNEKFLSVDQGFKITERKIILHLDIRKNIYEILTDFCQYWGIIDIGKIIRLACTHSQTYSQKEDVKVSQDIRALEPLGTTNPWTKASDDAKEYFANQQKKDIDHERQIIQDISALFEELAPNMARLETKLLFLSHERLARELGNHRYSIHSIYREFKEEVNKDTGLSCSSQGKQDESIS